MFLLLLFKVSVAKKYLLTILMRIRANKHETTWVGM